MRSPARRLSTCCATTWAWFARPGTTQPGAPGHPIVHGSDLPRDSNGVGIHGEPRCASSVTVPRFMVVETYATVHQLVSTVLGQLKPHLNAIDGLRACFPPGPPWQPHPRSSPGAGANGGLSFVLGRRRRGRRTAVRVHDRRAETAHGGDPGGPRGRPPRHLLGRPGLPVRHRRRRLGRRHSYRSPARPWSVARSAACVPLLVALRRSPRPCAPSRPPIRRDPQSTSPLAPAAPSSRSRTRTPSTTKWCSKRARSCRACCGRPAIWHWNKVHDPTCTNPTHTYKQNVHAPRTGAHVCVCARALATTDRSIDVGEHTRIHACAGPKKY